MSASRHTYAVCIKKDQLEIRDKLAGEHAHVDTEFDAALVVVWKWDDSTGAISPAIYGKRSDAEAKRDQLNDQWPDSYEVIQLR